ncbi:MAG: YabP/YqfC family sporulation protein [Oscillospiraceae bacterium]
METGHSITAENREKITLTGITGVDSYDGGEIVASCDGARVVIQGAALHIGSFEQGSGRLYVEGRLDAVQYLDDRSKGESFFRRIFR